MRTRVRGGAEQGRGRTGAGQNRGGAEQGRGRTGAGQNCQIAERSAAGTFLFWAGGVVATALGIRFINAILNALDLYPMRWAASQMMAVPSETWVEALRFGVAFFISLAFCGGVYLWRWREDHQKQTNAPDSGHSLRDLHLTLKELRNWGVTKLPPRIVDVPEKILEGDSVEPESTAIQRPPKTLSDLFKEDFNNTLRMNREYTISASEGGPHKISAKVCMNFAENSIFLCFFLPNSHEAYSLAVHLSGQYGQMMDEMRGKIEVEGGGPGESSAVASSGLLFTGRVYIYHESNLSDIERGNISSAFLNEGASVIFRGSHYFASRMVSANEHEIEGDGAR